MNTSVARQQPALDIVAQAHNALTSGSAGRLPGLRRRDPAAQFALGSGTCLDLGKFP
jgi:hypothetical protein